MMQRDLIAQIKLGMMFSLIEIITQLKKALEPSISNHERKMQEKSWKKSSKEKAGVPLHSFFPPRGCRRDIGRTPIPASGKDAQRSTTGANSENGANSAINSMERAFCDHKETIVDSKEEYSPFLSKNDRK